MDYFNYQAAKAKLPAKVAPVAIRKRDTRSEYVANVQLRMVRK